MLAMRPKRKLVFKMLPKRWLAPEIKVSDWRRIDADKFATESDLETISSVGLLDDEDFIAGDVLQILEDAARPPCRLTNRPAALDAETEQALLSSRGGVDDSLGITILLYHCFSTAPVSDDLRPIVRCRWVVPLPIVRPVSPLLSQEWITPIWAAVPGDEKLSIFCGSFCGKP
jgi:hypothetical protein